MNENFENHSDKAAGGQWSPSTPGLPNPEMLKFIERTRFIEIGDAACWDRREHILSIFGPVDFYELSSNNIAGLLQADESFDVMIVSVDDVQRLSLAISPPADIPVKRKLSFAYSSRTSPKMRAKLLRLGFDDALHGKMTPLEVLIRIQSAISRFEMYQSKSFKVSRDMWNLFCKQHVSGHLQKKQIDMLQTLLAADGEIVPYADLASFDFTTHQHRFDSLKVTVSRLRRALVGCNIEVARGRGYYLTYDQAKYG